MFYVIYATPEGFISTVHVADWNALKRLYDDLSTRHGYSYVQMGAVGIGIIEDKHTSHECRFGSKVDLTGAEPSFLDLLNKAIDDAKQTT